METFSKQFVASRPAAGGESCGAGFYFYFIEYLSEAFCIRKSRNMLY